MVMGRRQVMAGGLAGTVGILGAVGPRRAEARGTASGIINAAELGLVPNGSRDQSKVFQKILNDAIMAGQQVFVPAGHYLLADIFLLDGVQIIGVPGQTHLLYSGGKSFFSGDKANGILLSGLVFDGQGKKLDKNRTQT